MDPLASAILITWRRNGAYALRLVGDLEPAQFIAQPIPNRRLNHPAWVLSHLSLYTTIADALLRSAPFDDPAEHKYGAKSEPLSDNTAYPPPIDLVAVYRSAHESAERSLGTAPPERFAQPNPLERWRAVHPTVGDMLVT